MPESNINKADDAIQLVDQLISPLLKLERTMVMPFDRQRHENIGEHSFSLAVFGAAMARQIDPGLDTAAITEYATAHDLVEVYAGDVTVWESDEAIAKKESAESLAAKKIAEEYSQMPWLIDTFNQYLKLDTPEKRYVYAIDKLYPHILILAGGYHPVNPTWEAYRRTEQVARKKIALYPKLMPLFDELCRRFRQHPEFFSTPIPDDELDGLTDGRL